MTEPLGALALHEALLLTGRLYRWGASGPDHFDCSGLLDHISNLIGFHEDSRWTTGDYLNRLDQPLYPVIGDILVYVTEGGHPYHVGLIAGIFEARRLLVIGAHHGDHTTLTDHDALDRGAMVCPAVVTYDASRHKLRSWLIKDASNVSPSSQSSLAPLSPGTLLTRTQPLKSRLPR